jgi:hypothetical protein
LEPRLLLDEMRGEREEEIAAFLSRGGRADATSAAIRLRVAPGLPQRTWHRVFPALPKEVMADGSLLVWHPLGEGWAQALDRVHARRRVHWRLSGALLQWPGSGELSAADLSDFDDMDIADWSLAVPHPGFRAFCAASRAGAPRLSELVARWAFEVGPEVAGRVLAGCRTVRACPCRTTH